MKTLSQFLLLLLLFIFFSCNKYAGSVDPHYIGEWHSKAVFTTSNGKITETYFIIDGKKSEYGLLCDTACVACECQLLTSGKATINKKKTKLFIGSGNGNKRVSLKINEPPHLNANGKWECKVNDVIMLKK